MHANSILVAFCYGYGITNIHQTENRFDFQFSQIRAYKGGYSKSQSGILHLEQLALFWEKGTLFRIPQTLAYVYNITTLYVLYIYTCASEAYLQKRKKRHC